MRRGISVGFVVGTVLACGGSGETERPARPSSAALAVKPSGGCHVGKNGSVEIPPDGKYDLAIDAESSLVLRYTPFTECGGSKSIVYTASFGAGALRVEGSGGTSSSKAGVTWKVVVGGGPGLHFVSSVITTSPVVDAGTNAGATPAAPKSSPDARDLDTIVTVDSSTRARTIALDIVTGDETTYYCVFQLGWTDSQGEYESCGDDDDDDGGCGSKHSSKTHPDFDD